MKCSELAEGDTAKTERQELLIGGETVAIAIRIPKNLLESAAERACA